jgi:hypothetical protein
MAIAPHHPCCASFRLVDRWVLTGTSPCACTGGRAAR